MFKTHDPEYSSQLIQRKLDAGCEIRPFPRSVNQLITALKDPNSKSKVLAQIIESDAGLSARLLRMANSPLFGVTQEITSICRAVTLLGRRPLKNLAFTYVCSTLFSGSSRTAQSRQAIWNHSMGCAITARLLANSVPSVSADDAFLASLFHDIGKLFLLGAFPKEYEKFSASKWGNELLRLERQRFGVSHDELSLRLIVAWPLRDELKVAVRHHHCPENSDPHDALTRVLHVADALARSAGIGSCSAPDTIPAESAHKYFGLTEQDLWSIQDKAFNAFIETKQDWAS